MGSTDRGAWEDMAETCTGALSSLPPFGEASGCFHSYEPESIFWIVESCSGRTWDSL